MRVVHYSDVENAYDDPERIGRLAGLLRELDGPDAVLAGTGDNTGPGVLPMVTEGRVALPFFERVRPDVDTVGNHDFDYGVEGLRAIVAESPQTWVCANVPDGDRFGATPWTIVEADGARVGITGVTTTTTPSITPTVPDLRVDDPVESAREALATLRERDVDATVVLAHLRDDEGLAWAVDADLVLGGHVHEARSTTVGGTPVTRPGANGEYVYEIELGVEPRISRHAVADAAVDRTLAAAARNHASSAGLDEPVVTVDTPIERTPRTTMSGESRIGNLVADAYQWLAGVDVGLQNGGGIRTGPPLDGTVTVQDLMGVVPFEEDVVVAELSGAELRAVLSEASGAVLDVGDSAWWNAHVSGVEATWNRAERRFESLLVGGEPLDPDATYELATSEYLLYTEHEFPTLTEDHHVRSLCRQYEALVDYAREAGIDPEIEGRIERIGI